MIGLENGSGSGSVLTRDIGFHEALSAADVILHGIVEWRLAIFQTVDIRNDDTA